ncbi:MAG TPA: hypothetical protein VHU80_10800 [Polyangiaceae bacterium]|nr:hypothetical protein [Polyangiaceae bacterium]
MSIVFLGKLARGAGCVSMIVVLSALQACGDDHEDAGSAVAAACNSSCNATAGKCQLPVVTAQACATLCDLGYSVAPACAGRYQTYVNCTGASPLIACTGNTVAVNVSVPPCLNELGDYLTCAAGNIQLCIDLPLDDGACTQASMPPHARACVGSQAGCQLLTGIEAAVNGSTSGGGVGVVCCP